MSRPRILIPTPTSFDEAYNQRSWPEYAAAVAEAGGDPVRVNLTHSMRELQAEVSQAGGVLLPGSGADVDPAHYGHVREPACAEPDRLREQTDRAIFEAAGLGKTPLLGICLGAQSMNVYYGGTLIQDLPPVPVNHAAGRAVQTAHMAVVAESSRLGDILATAEDAEIKEDATIRVPVNSSHHQAIYAPGDSLRAVARCPQDGVIEALEGGDPEHWLVGVQWHPERTCVTSEASRLLFRAFVNASVR